MSAPFLAVAGREVRVSGRLLLLLCLGVVLVAYLFSAAFPAFKERLLAAGRHAPAFVRRLIEARSGGVKVESFIGLVYAHPVVLALMTTWPVNRATGAIAGEIERGALAWKLAYPIGRAAYVGAKALVMGAGAALMAFTLFAGFIVSFKLLHIPFVGPMPYAWASLAGFALYTAIGMLTLWASALSHRAAMPALIGTGIALGSYLLENVGEMWDPLKPYRWLSLFHYADQSALLTGQAPSWRNFAVLGTVALIGLVGALVSFSRRDLSI